MKTMENRAVSIVVLVLVAYNDLFLSANGLLMLLAPAAWYEFVPGVTDTGFFNFPAVSLSAIIGVMLTLWAFHHARAVRAAYS